MPGSEPGGNLSTLSDRLPDVMTPADRYEEAPRRVLAEAFARLPHEPLALCVVTATKGGAVRAPGALMLIDENAERRGYMSGGCIDEDIAGHALRCLESGDPVQLTYGVGSPFIDMPLPCGGAIEILILPLAQTAPPAPSVERLKTRRPLTLAAALEGLVPPLPESVDLSRYIYEPELRIRIAGRGADALALARLARFANFDVLLQLIDEADIRDATREGLSCERLTSPANPPPVADDRWTAFLLAFHDHEWETALLTQALAGPAFYIGAVGSPRTQDRRRQALAKAGLEPALDRISGPIGLVPSQRDATKVAISAFAEILQHASAPGLNLARRTGVVLLAAGSGRRFADGDKLLAPYCDAPILARAAQHRHGAPFANGVAVVPNGAAKRRDVLEQAGWSVVENQDAAQGKSTSLRRALDTLSSNPEVEGAIILLGDMPNVRRDHLLALLARAAETGRPVFTDVDGRAMPPAYIPRTAFAALSEIEGDAGLLSVFDDDAFDRVPLDAFSASDVDTVADLAAMTREKV